MVSNLSERKRVREVRKYYTRSPHDVPIAGAPLPPGRDGLESTKGMVTTAVASPNKTLTALMQLIACRLGMQRAMVSVVDENAQYFLAESTKTLDLVDPLTHDEGDELWMGCGGTIRSEALCANTIKLPCQEKSYACFSVSDLPLDPRFCKLPYVAGPPFFRFYAGTPLLTRDNVPIGSVFVIDTRARGPPTEFEINILGIMARNVMEYLEMRRESEMRKRNQIMSQGLACLVDGKFSILPPSKSEKPKRNCCLPNGTSPAPEAKLEESVELPAVISTTAGTISKCSVLDTSSESKEDVLPSDSTASTSANAFPQEESSNENVTTLKIMTENTSSILEADSKAPSFEASQNRLSRTAESIFEERSSHNTLTTPESVIETATMDSVTVSETKFIPSEDCSLIDVASPHVEEGSGGIAPTNAKLTFSSLHSSDPASFHLAPIQEEPSQIVQISRQPPNRRPSLKGSELNGSQGSQGSSYLQTKSQVEENGEIQTDEQIMHRAANLLRESLNVDYAIFLDVIEDFVACTTSEESNVSSTGSDEERPSLPPRQDSGVSLTFDLESNDLPGRQKRPLMPTIRSSRSSLFKESSAKIVSFSSQISSSINQEDINPEHGFRSPACKQLRRLVKRYPEGKLWTFNDEGAELSDDEESVGDVKNASTTTKLSETRFLIQCFPGARQILYAPLFNVEKSIHVAACFCVSLEPTPIFTPELELAFLRAFVNNVSVACNRSSMATANRLKGDFISSISHELRSPLHGILASVELLSTSTLDRPQKEYCSTISTCGQALLETITGILEYTKINTLRKDSKGSFRPNEKRPLLLRNTSSEGGTPNQSVPDLLASSNVDIGKVCEDSCLLVAAAYIHHTSTPDQPLYRVFVSPEAARQLNGDVSTAPPAVVVILDISPGNWKLVALPGALQRIVMNLVGNSLKYTSSGFVKVKLDIHPLKGDSESKGEPNSSVIELNVIDSGRGISNEFLKTKLFSPFSQETILAPGTGLGLHLVKSLVQMHDGSIDIQSEVGVGTHVTVKLRLQEAPFGCEAPESGLQLARNESDDTIAEVRRSEKNKSFFLYGFHNSTTSYIKDSLHLYLTKWFGMTTPPEGKDPAIVITNEDRLAACLSYITTYRQRPQVIVVCDQMRRKHLNETHSRSYNSLELLTIPFGPYKLSKVILACLEAEPESEQLPPYLNGFHIPNPDALKFADGVMFSPVAFLESPYSSGGDSFPWNAPATQIPVDMHNVRDLPTPIPGATLPNPPPTTVTPQPQFPLMSKKSVESIAETAPVVDHNQPRILCVDDNSINLRLLKTFMQKLKFKSITCAENGSLAFEAVRCQKEPFDLIFMDLSMPVCDGFQAISLIRTLEKINLDISAPNLPLPKPALIVALTGLASQRDQDAAKEAGADHYITKPMKLSLLKRLLVEWGISAEGVVAKA